jgi:Tfp pilus assembly protein PilF
MEVASYYLRKGDPDAAIPRLEDAIRLKPKLAKPRLMLAETYEKKGDAAAAVKCYKDYLQAFPNAPDEKKIEKKIEKLSGQ